MLTPLDAPEIFSFTLWLIIFAVALAIAITMTVVSHRKDWEVTNILSITSIILLGVAALFTGIGFGSSAAEGRFDKVALEGTVTSVAGDTIIVDGVPKPVMVSDGSFIREGDLVAGHCYNAAGESLKCYGLGLSGGN